MSCHAASAAGPSHRPHRSAGSGQPARTRLHLSHVPLGYEPVAAAPAPADLVELPDVIAILLILDIIDDEEEAGGGSLCFVPFLWTSTSR